MAYNIPEEKFIPSPPLSVTCLYLAIRIRHTFKISDEELLRAVEKNKALKGGYEKRLFLSWSSDTEYASRDRASKDEIV